MVASFLAGNVEGQTFVLFMEQFQTRVFQLQGLVLIEENLNYTFIFFILLSKF